MDKNLQENSQSCRQVSFEALSGAAEPAPGVAGSAGLSPASGHSDFRFPPTRAARASRSRGVFLGEAEEAMNEGRVRWIEVPVALVALAAAAFMLVVCVNASSIVAGPSIGSNPGPAIVAAASVPPNFVVPVRLR